MFSVFDFKGLKVHHWPPTWQRCLESWLTSLYERSQSMATVRSHVSIVTHFFNDGYRQPWTYTPTEIAAFAIVTFPYSGLLMLAAFCVNCVHTKCS